MFNSLDLIPGYRVWSRKNEEGSLWAAMPYAPRDTEADAWRLVENYEERFGNLYTYTVLRCGIRPAGLCVPYT